MNTKKTAAFVYIFLILIFPLQSAVVFGEIRKATVSGQDQREGYRRIADDQTSILVEARVTGDTDITPEQIRIRAEGRVTPFRDLCTKLSDGYSRCIYTTSRNAQPDQPRVYPFVVQLFTDANTLADERELTLTYDHLPPQIAIENIKQEKDEVALTLRVADVACAECAGKCVGLASVDIDGMTQNVSGCTFAQTVFLPMNEEGFHVFFVQAKDNFGQSARKETASFFIDGRDPVIEKISILQDGQPITSIGAEGIRAAWVVALVQEHNLVSLRGDLSQLNRLPEFQQLYKQRDASCIRMSQDRFQCVWRDIYVLPEKESVSISLTVLDTVGHSTIKEMPVQLPLDTEKPKIIRLTTSGCKDDTCYVSLQDNVIRADIEEQGSGFTPFTSVNGEPRYLVGLDAHELSQVYSTLWANNCTGKGKAWTCLWTGVQAVGPHLRTLRITVPALSSDDAGNTFTGDTSKRVIVDTQPPILLAVNASTETVGVLIGNTPLTIGALVQDDTPIRGQAFLSAVAGVPTPVSIECIPQPEKRYLCLWTQVAPLLSGPLRGVKIPLVFHDLGGNSVNTTLLVDILEKETEKKMYWGLGGKPFAMPKLLDRDTLGIEQRVYFTIPLAGPEDARIIDGGILDCKENTGFSAVRILSAEGKTLLVQATVGPLTPDPSLTHVKATCTASLLSVIENERLTQPQEIDLLLEIPVVSALGQLENTVAQKIEDAKNWDLYGLRKIFKPLEGLYKISEQICGGISLFSSRFSGSLGGMMGMGSGVGGFGAGALGLGLMSSGFGSGTGGLGSMGALGPGLLLTAQGNDKMFSSMAKYCQYLSCDKTLWGNWYADMIREPQWSKKRHLGATAWPQNPKDNLFLSMATGCIPGILYNLNKYKQLQCIYVDCLQNQVKEGVPMQYCVNQHEYLKCRFMYGQVFDLIPFAHVVKRMGISIKTIFANPLSMLFGLGSFTCEQQSSSSGLCMLARGIPQALTLVNQFQRFGDFQNDLLRQNRAQNVCAKVGME